MFRTGSGWISLGTVIFCRIIITIYGIVDYKDNYLVVPFPALQERFKQLLNGRWLLYLSCLNEFKRLHVFICSYVLRIVWT